MADFNTPDSTLMALLASSTEALRLDPHNETLRTGILQNQVNLTAKQLNLTQLQAAHTVRSFTNAYAYSKGYDPKAVMDALNSAQQQILDYDKNKPTLYGMDLVAANKVASYFAAAAGVTLALSIIAFCVALFMIGPEIAATVLAAGGVVEALTAVTGVAVGTTGGGAIAIGTFLFLISQMLGHMSASIPMWTKQMVDNGTIAASLQITAIKNVADVTAQLTGTKAPGPYDSTQFSALFNGLQAAGFTQVKNPVDGTLAPLTQQTLAQLINYLYGTQIGIGAPATASKITPLINPWLYKGGSNNPIPLSLYDQVSNDYAAPATSTSSSSGAASQSAPAQSSGSGAASSGVPNLQIFTGVISGGTLGLPQEFIATPAQMISSAQDLINSAKVNLASAVASLPGRFYYEIGIVSTIKTKSGLTQKGAAVQLITGYYKNGKPKTKTVFYKFAVMNLGVTDENGRTVKLAQINLGPVDVTVFSPSPTQLTGVQNTIASSTFTTDITQISNVVSPTPPTTSTTAPANPSPPVVTPPTVPANSPATQQQGSIVPQSSPATSTSTSAPTPYSLVLAPSAPGNYGAGTLFLYGVDLGGAGDVLINGGLYSVQKYNSWWTAIAESSTPYGGNPAKYGIRDIGTFPALNNYPAGSPQAATAATSSSGTYQLERSSVPGGVELIYTPPGMTVNTSLRVNNNPATQNAQTLSDWWSAAGGSLPSLSDRAALFQEAGLGPSGTYIGSADQNNKLLGWLKSH